MRIEIGAKERFWCGQSADPLSRPGRRVSGPKQARFGLSRSYEVCLSASQCTKTPLRANFELPLVHPRSKRNRDPGTLPLRGGGNLYLTMGHTEVAARFFLSAPPLGNPRKSHGLFARERAVGWYHGTRAIKELESDRKGSGTADNVCGRDAPTAQHFRHSAHNHTITEPVRRRPYRRG